MISKWKERIWIAVVSLIVAACALPFGSVTATWSFSLRMALALAVLASVMAGLPRKISGQAKVVLGCVIGVALLGALQMLPAPVALVDLVSPGHAYLAHQAAEVLGEADRWIPLTVSRELTVASIAAWLAVGCALLAGIFAGRLSTRYWVYIAAAVSALFQVLYGLGMWWNQRSVILGREVVGDLSRVRGTFVNPDHFSLHLEIVLALVPAVAWWMWRETQRRMGTGRAVIVMLPLAAYWMLLTGVVALSGSRAGLAAVAVGLAAQGLCLLVWGKDRISGGIVLGGGTVALFGLVLMTGGRGFSRLMGTTAYQVTADLRWTVIRSSLELWQAYPVFGSGLGTFVVAYPRFQPAAAEGGVWRHAHNGWVEMLATTGLVGIALLVIGLAMLALGLRNTLIAGERTRHRAVALAGLGVLATIAFHESVEFGLTMPANATLAAVLVGVGLGAPVRRLAMSTSQRPGPSLSLPRHDDPA